MMELMRAIVLLCDALEDSGAELPVELAHYRKILERRCEAATSRHVDELAATASGLPQPEDT